MSPGVASFFRGVGVAAVIILAYMIWLVWQANHYIRRYLKQEEDNEHARKAQESTN